MSIRITNYGLDTVAAVDSNVDLSHYAPYENWHMYTAIGTGSAAPSQSDTALSNEVARSSSTGGNDPTFSYNKDAQSNIMWYESTSYRVFNFTSAYNLTEYGHLTSSSGANAVFRDLFRQDPNDPNSQAVTISVQDGDQLQIIKEFRLNITWEEQNKTITITGLGDSTGTQTVFAKDGDYYSGTQYIFKLLWAGESNKYARLITAASSTSKTENIASLGDGLTMTRDSYSTGSYTLTCRGKFDTSQGNGDIYGWTALGHSGSNFQVHYGLKFVMTDPTSFTKQDTYTLELVLTLTWDRG